MKQRFFQTVLKTSVLMMLLTNDVWALNCQIGDIYYSDDTCKATYDYTKRPIGVVYDANAKGVVSLRTVNVKDLGTFSNQSDIWNAAKNYCNSMKLGNKTWTLPLTDQVFQWYSRYNDINNGLAIGSANGYIITAMAEDTYYHGLDLNFGGEDNYLGGIYATMWEQCKECLGDMSQTQSGVCYMVNDMVLAYGSKYCGSNDRIKCVFTYQ
ncbi:MAG: hypothetical protein IJ660_00085 [Alphaproteobacteria bacterium]|nr:hypothetical protein [Alphaproteobacteria bacterium]